MKRFLIPLGVAALSSPAFADGPTLEEYRALQKRVESLEISVKTMMASKTDASVAREPAAAIAPIQIVAWSAVKWYDGSQPYYKISYTIANNSPKTIKLIDATLGFQDVHGEELFSIPIDRSLLIAPGKVALIAGNHMVWYWASRENAGQERFSKMAKDDIVGKLVVRSLIYNDNTIVEYAP